mmetsp:Transcript_16692/g.23195  ORF Transcript_16692/g.23195 Transcript_16692/m.23195 type:complete len:592 (-) Transcript_16692:663-2438(-)
MDQMNELEPYQEENETSWTNTHGGGLSTSDVIGKMLNDPSRMDDDQGFGERLPSSGNFLDSASFNLRNSNNLDADIMNLLTPSGNLLTRSQEEQFILSTLQQPNTNQTPIQSQVPPGTASFQPKNVPNITSNTPSSPSKILSEVIITANDIVKACEKIRVEQKQALYPIQPDLFSALDRQQKEVKSAIEMCDKQLNYLLDTQFLDSAEMHQLLQAQSQLAILIKQLELYIQELYSLKSDSFLPSFALVILSQPFPDSVKQNKSIDEPVTVKLLTGAKFDSRPNSASVRAEIINVNSKNKKMAVGIENGEKLINAETGIATFNDLKFPNGTRLKSIRVKFTSKITVQDSKQHIHHLSIETNPTNPIVVKTNENQWHEAEGILLKKTAFGGQLEIYWPRLANWVQRRYLIATKQNLQTPVRPLSSYDLHYMHRLKFENKPVISQKDFDNFWTWFGPLLHKIRYQRHICTLWTRGFIAGFLTREEVDAVLKNEQIGTFLVRFSERTEAFVVSYQSSEGVKHYLLKADDTHGAKKTLPDFLRDYRDFVCILQLWTDKNSDKRILKRCDKDSTLKEYYSKKSTPGVHGYDDDIHVV